MHDLSRKFFHKLLRHGQVTKAFRLAVDINDYDLFMDLHHLAAKNEMHDLAEASLIKAHSVFADVDASSLTGDSNTNDEDIQEYSPHHGRQQPGHSGSVVQQHKQELHVSSLPRPSYVNKQPPMDNPPPMTPMPPASELPGPMQLFSSLRSPVEYAQVGEHQANIQQDHEPQSIESVTMQPQLSATFLKTTSAKRIATNEYQTKAEVAAGIVTSTSSLPTASVPGDKEVKHKLSTSSLASLPKGMAAQATKLENPDDIKVIHFGVV